MYHMNQLVKAAKKVAAVYNSISLILRIAIGLVVGAILTLVCPGAVWLEELGNLFVGALKGIAPVLVFVIVASALAQGSSKLDRRFGMVVWLYMLTTFVAAALSVVTSKLFPQTLVLAEAAEAEYVVHEEVPADQPEEHKACPQCGAPVSDDALFCNKCGAQL